jgi:hypothetical protein
MSATGGQNQQDEMSNTYYFIENRYPQNDPNIDLNFDNDILYSDIIDDEVDRYDSNAKNDKTILPIKPTGKKDIRKQKRTNKTNYSIYFYFILAIITLMLIWYFYKDRPTEKKNIIDTYPNNAELTMLSPDMGMGSRFARKQ